jgi:hypothetical protein
MRYGLLVLCLAIGIGLYQGWFARAYDHVTTAALSEDARLAIDLRCQDQVERAARDCRSLLKKLYLAGSLDPDKTLRFYCESVKTGRWGGSRPEPPAVCVERYGAWPTS